jgi:hypothetical protein
MRLVLHILLKDARRFWWEIAVTLGLLASVARMDATRVGFIPGAMEGWLNLILPAVWAYLVALVIHDEALVGDRQFWLTRPYPWPALLVAKALFVLVFIHFFSFAVDVAILASRGFEPLAASIHFCRRGDRYRGPVLPSPDRTGVTLGSC